jgi:hypothetical protein
MLLVISFIGSVIGFYVCYRTLIKLKNINDENIRMRICMINSMSLAFIFAMLVELATGSKSLAVILPMISVCTPVLWTIRQLNVVDIMEVSIASLMSVSMSVMLIGMIDNQVILVIQSCLLSIEALLYIAVTRKIWLT